MATVSRPLEFLAQFEKATSNLKTPLTLVEAGNWVAAKAACDASDNASDKAQYLAMLETSLGKRKVALFNKLESICINEIKYLINSYGSVSTVFPVITKYRKAFKSVNPDHVALAFFKMPKSEYAQRRIDYKVQVKKEIADKRPYFNDIGMIALAKDLLKSDSYMSVAMGLCLLTGRRPNEILSTAQFKAVEGVNDVVVFSGQLKTKDSDLSEKNKLIPILAPANEVITALAKLRKMRDFSALDVPLGDTLGQVINRKTAKTQTECVNRYFSEFLPEWQNSEGKTEKVKPYNLRQVYLDICFRWFVNGKLNLSVIPELKKDDKNMFCSIILGHTKDDLATVNSYMRVKYQGND